MTTNLAAGVRAFTSNAFLVTGEQAVLVDVGSNFDVVERVREETGTLDAVVITHTHSDHVGNLGAVREAFDVDVWGYDEAAEGIDERLRDGWSITMGDHDYRALHTPGHARDHLCLYSESAGVLFAGDLIFQNGSFGRTDLPGASRETLIESIGRVLETVDESLRAIHCGHGPSMTEDAYHHIELAHRFAQTV